MSFVTPCVDGYSSVTSSVTSWMESRSPETTSTLKPCSRPCLASVARMSSASKSSFTTVVMPIACRASRSSGTCPLNSTGVASRPALYSGYSRVRKELREISKATAMWLGFSFWSRLRSIETKPWIAFVCCPSEFTKLSTGRAKNALKASEWPSMTMRVG